MENHYSADYPPRTVTELVLSGHIPRESECTRLSEVRPVDWAKRSLQQVVECLFQKLRNHQIEYKICRFSIENHLAFQSTHLLLYSIHRMQLRNADCCHWELINSPNFPVFQQ